MLGKRQTRDLFQKSYFIKYFIFLIFSFFSENILAQDENSIDENLSIDLLTPTNFIDNMTKVCHLSANLLSFCFAARRLDFLVGHESIKNMKGSPKN